MKEGSDHETHRHTLYSLFTSTTQISLRDKPTELDPQSNPLIVEHNRLTVKVMAEMNIPVNDLYTLMSSRTSFCTYRRLLGNHTVLGNYNDSSLALCWEGFWR